MDRKFNIEEVKNAYQRFKSYVYYDNFNLHLRYKLAKFEEDDIDSKIRNICDSLNGSSELDPNVTIQRWIHESGYIVIPKKISHNKDNEEGEDQIVISNSGETGPIKISRATILYDGPIELFVISTIWTIMARDYLNISSDSYGYILPKNKSSKLLFEPYFNKYQEWRDKGLSAAQQQIKNGNKILFITLDIKNFFHSSVVNFSELRKITSSDSNKRKFTILTNILEKICWDHSEKVNKEAEKPFLPIGLPSSGIIANWLLSNFDEDLKEATAPVYYGRYVDDIFIVVSNVKPPKKDPENWLFERFFSKGDIFEIKDKSFLIKSKKCRGLEIQQKKLRLFYFDPHWPMALLNKFQLTIQENSSAFWFLPNEEDLRDSLDDTYDIRYEDTINKFRSVSSCKVNKYAASVFLAKRLRLAILSPTSHDKRLEEEIFRFFNGESIISMYSMWEKVFAYFAIIGNYQAILKLQKKIEEGIEKIMMEKQENNSIPHDLDKCLKESLEKHMLISLMLAKTHVKSSIGSPAVYKDIALGSKLFKRALLTRHFHLSLPILSLTKEYIQKEFDVNKFDFEKSCPVVDESIISKNWIIPRYIGVHEICALYLPVQLKNIQKKYSTTEFDDYVEFCLDLYERLNGVKLDEKIFCRKHKEYFENKSGKKERRIYSKIISVADGREASGQIKIGISNVNTSEKDVQNALSKKSILYPSKRKRHIDILNQAESLKVDMLLLPEVFVPLNWLSAYADESRRKQRSIIMGLEHFSINRVCYNITVAILPFVHQGRKEALIIPRLKNHYSPMEMIEIEGLRKRLPVKKYSTYHLYQWRGIQFSVYNCFELTDIVHRSIFRSELDILFAVEYNKDVNYFSSISETVSRDLHCYYVQANTSNYGDSRVVEPKKSNYQNPVRVKGGDNDIILTHKLDISSLRRFQNKTYVLQKDDPVFKMTPPDFQHEKVEQRGKKNGESDV